MAKPTAQPNQAINRAYRIGINTEIVGKCQPQNLSHGGAWHTVDYTIEQLATHIDLGHPWMPAVLDGNGKRWQSNANHAEVLALDIDAGMTIVEALNHPFVAAHCALLIESASSTPEHNKFRLGFVLPEVLTDWQSIRLCNRFLADQIGHADPACKDASRFFFGAPGRKPILLNPEARLPVDFAEQVRAWDAELERVAQIERDRRAAYLATMPVTDRAELAKAALKFIPAYTSGNGTYNDLIVMMAGVVNDLGSEGEALLDAWGGFGQDTAKKVSGLTRSSNNKASLGSLFYLAKERGFQFPQREFTAEQKRAYGELKRGEREAARVAAGTGFTVIDGGKREFTEIERRDWILGKRREAFSALRELLELDYKMAEGDALEFQAGITTQHLPGAIDWYDGYCPTIEIPPTPNTTYV
jgi:hypothetical protein